MRRSIPCLADVNAVINSMTRPGISTRSSNNLTITQEMIKRLRLEKELSTLKFVHIAGTKGKGSTSFATANLLQQAGLRVGLFTSPHLVDVRERFLVNGQMIDEDSFSQDFINFRKEHDDAFESTEWPADESGGAPPQKTSFFRFAFLFSLRLFVKQKVDVVVVEVGIGGRIDSTNAITPAVCGITALGFDHMDLLGNTIEAIAGEKAGIIKPGVPCFSSAQCDYPQTLAVLSNKAAEVGAPLRVVTQDWYNTSRGVEATNGPTASGGDDVWAAIRRRGHHMVENSKLALALSRTFLGKNVDAPVEQAELDALRRSEYPGRSQVIPIAGTAVKIYLDGAHTMESIRAAAKWFVEASGAAKSRGRPASVLFFSSRDNKKLLRELLPVGEALGAVTFVTFPHDSSQLPNTGPQHVVRAKEAWEEVVRERKQEDQQRHDQGENPEAALDDIVATVEEVPLTSLAQLVEVATRNVATAPGEEVPVFITGSLYLVGAVTAMVREGSPASLGAAFSSAAPPPS